MMAINVKEAFEALYARQIQDDGALDLFEPSVELLVAPYYERVRPLLNPVAESDAFLSKFGEYFTAKGMVDVVSREDGRTAATIERSAIPLWLETDCERPIHTWSIPRPCLQVRGRRGTYGIRFNQLFIGDLLWLFFHERMGIHAMVGALLDDFVTRGRFPLRPLGVEGLMLEGLVREVKAGLSSTCADRDTSYRRCLGLTSETGKVRGNPNAPLNSKFLTLWHSLIHLVSGYYNEKRLAVAIQNSATAAGRPSRATLTSIKETVGQLRKAFDPFKYGRNHTHTLSGIVWTLSGFELILRLRSQLGIPEPYQSPDELIPAAYTLLLGEGGTVSGGNRYTAHRDCATAGRAILLDVQALDFDQTSVPLGDAELIQWLDDVESSFELYRSAFRVLTGVDLATTAAAEQF
jgi:hypothetical protein